MLKVEKVEERYLRAEVVKKEPVYMVLMNEEKCCWPEAVNINEETTTRICCMYTEDENLYVCPYCGEEIKIDGAEEVGGAKSYCTYPV